MLAHLPRLPIGLDALIKEGKRRMRRRRLVLSLALAAVVAVSLALALRPGEAPKPNSGLGGTASAVPPKNPLVVLDHSIGPVRLGELRKSVEKALGPGHTIARGEVTYFGGRLTVNYWFKETLANYVAVIETHWPGFHTDSGFRVGASRQAAASIPRMTCGAGECGRYLLPRHADGPMTQIYMRHGRVTEIDIGYG